MVQVTGSSLSGILTICPGHSSSSQRLRSLSDDLVTFLFLRFRAWRHDVSPEPIPYHFDP